MENTGLNFGIKLHCYEGTDGVPVVHLDTPVGFEENGSGPVMRIYLNDALFPIYANPDLDMQGGA